MPAPPDSSAAEATSVPLVRSLIGGSLMGMANLVPGVSGGTMLLVCGVYPTFINGVAEVTRLRFRPRTLVTLALIAGAAALAIVALAGLIRTAVVEARWAMYSVFIGLTLGGAPVVWRVLRPANQAAWLGCAAGIAVMGAMAYVKPTVSEGDGPSYLLLFLAGLAGASAMILPGISGGYLLLILGQYLVILGAIDDARTALLAAGGPNLEVLLDSVKVFLPVGLGVVSGVVGVSNLIRWLLARHGKATLGTLLGLLLGAVLGLWPFQRGVAPRPGDVVKGRALTAAEVALVDPDDYPLETFRPSATQILGSLALIGAGFALTQGVSRLGADSRD